MTSFIKYAVFDFTKKRRLIVILTMICLVLIYSLYNFTYAPAKSIYYFVLGVLFNIFQLPIFLIFLSLFLYQADWMMIRRFRNRLVDSLYTLFIAMLFAIFFTTIIFLYAVIFYHFPSSWAQLLEIFTFAWRYLLTILLFMLLYLLIESLVHNRFLAFIIPISIEIIEQENFAFLAFFMFGQYKLIFTIILLLTIVFMSCCLLIIQQRRNFYIKEE